MIARSHPEADLLTYEALRDVLDPIGRDYIAAIVLTADMLPADRRAAIRARHDAYLTALAATLDEATEASVRYVRGARIGGRP